MATISSFTCIFYNKYSTYYLSREYATRRRAMPLGPVTFSIALSLFQLFFYFFFDCLIFSIFLVIP